MAYDIDAFVNGNAANVTLDANLGTHGFDDIEREFLDGLATETDGSDDAGFPVMVYTRMGQPVAWADLELSVGYAG